MKKIVVTVLIALGSLLFFNLLRANEYPDVNATYDYENIDYSDYTDKDTFDHEGFKYTLTDYMDFLWKKNITTTRNYDTSDPVFIDVNIKEEDNPITQIIPRDFFVYRGEYFHIGKEYAFYVKTTAFGEYNNIIDVFLIDIESTYSMSTIVNRIIPLMQMTFLYFTEQTNMEYSSKTWIDLGGFAHTYKVINKTGKKTLILPKIETEIIGGTNIFIPTFRYKNEFNLKNITLGTAIYNEQQLNIGDENYIDMDDEGIVDKGSFIIRTDLTYGGNRIDGGSVTPGGIGKEVASFIIPTVVGFMGPLGDFASIAIDLTNTIMSIADQCKETVTTVEQGDTGVDVKYGSAEEQIKKGGSLNKFGFVSTKDNKHDLEKRSMVIGNGGYFGASFSLGQTQGLWATRVNTVIEMEITDAHGRETIIKKSSFFRETIRDFEYKQLMTGREINGYSLNDGKDCFEFTPIYSSSYILKKSTLINSAVKICDSNGKNIDQLSTNSNEIECFFEKGKTYKIEIESKCNDQYRLLIDVKTLYKGINSNISDGLYKFQTTESDILKMIHSNDALLTLLDTGLYDVLRSNISKSMINYYFANKIYYIYVENAADSNNELIIDEIETNVLDETISVNNSIGGDIIYRFAINKTGVYSIATQNFPYTSFGTVLFRKNGERIDYTQKVTTFTKVIEFSVDENDIIYFGSYEIEKGLKYSLSLTQNSDEFSWMINGVKINKNEIEAKQGERLNYKLNWYNQPFIGVVYTGNSSELEILENNIIVIKNNAIIDKPGDKIKVNAAGTRNDEISLISLSIIVKSPLEFKLEKVDDGTENAGVRITTTFINNSSIKIKGYFYASGVSNRYVELSLSGITAGNYVASGIVKVDKNIAVNSKRSNWDFKLYQVDTKQVIKDSELGSTGTYESTKAYNLGINNINVLFGGGNGTSSNPYIISNSHHLDKMWNVSYTYYDDERATYITEINSIFKLTSNITYWNWSTLKETFTGKFYGDSRYTIKFSSSGSFFDRIENATINNINFDATVNTNDVNYAAAIAKIAEGSTISNCYLTGTVSSSNAKYVGGLFAMAYRNNVVGNQTILDNVTASFTVFGKYNVGGMIGLGANVLIRNSNFTGKVKLGARDVSNDDDNGKAGGFVGVSGDFLNLQNCRSFAIMAYDGGVKNKSKVLNPKMGGIIGEGSRNDSHSNSNSDSVEIDYGSLNTSWKEWFTTYSQSHFVNKYIGKLR